MLIRPETSADLDAIDAIHRAAFPAPDHGVEPVEARLVRELRNDPGWIPALSLVAEGDAEAAVGPGRPSVVGHVVCTSASVGDSPALGLGPIGVLPAVQGSGVGTALLHTVLGAADALDHPVVVLLGHLDYYPRFGFVPARSMGIEPPDPEWGGHFQARALGAWTPACAGPFRYAAPFEAL